MTMTTAREQRAQDQAFVLRANLEALRERVGLPLRWPALPDLPPSPKPRYRSTYRYRGYADLYQSAVWEHLSPFDLSLRLIDFSGARPLLAHRLGWTSARGYEPYDPVSVFLLLGWQDEHHWNRHTLLNNLADPRYADYAWRFGFTQRRPTEGGLRYFLTALGAHSEVDGEGKTITVGEPGKEETFPIQQLNQLLLPALALILQAGVLSPKAWTEALLGLDGMLRPAASRMKCYAVTASCYQPVTPGATPPRPCPAKDEAKPEEKDHCGCACDTPACQQACRYTTPWDADARFVRYSGSNQPNQGHQGQEETGTSHDPHAPGPGKKVYGYRELAIQLVDLQRRCHLPVLCDFRPANDGESGPMAALLAQLLQTYQVYGDGHLPGPGVPGPDLVLNALNALQDLNVDAVVGDAAFGQEPVLSVTYKDLRARRVIDLRAHDCDKDKAHWPVRGYDDKGRPLCEFGYGLTANGFDAQRQRHKWFCGKVCQQGIAPLVRLPNTQYPPPECPALEADLSYGKILNVGLCFGDLSTRLVRDLVPGTPDWKALYSVARNASEGHNAGVEQHDQKRMPVYGLWRGKGLSFLHNAWEILTTLARLVQEATRAQTQAAQAVRATATRTAMDMSPATGQAVSLA